ncbi:hypothetical protein Pelo_941 [Pelomyxa schiedti]|nr:hypothetical protein Pelo_941 [Pelomyxa schiedti]
MSSVCPWGNACDKFGSECGHAAAARGHVGCLQNFFNKNPTLINVSSPKQMNVCPTPSPLQLKSHPTASILLLFIGLFSLVYVPTFFILFASPNLTSGFVASPFFSGFS